MPDPTYQPKVYREQGSDSLVIASGGTLTAQTGSTVNLADATVVQPPALVQVAEVSLTNAEIKALRATPKTLVAAPGAGKALVFHLATLLLDAGTNALTESADNLAVKYENGSGDAVSDTIETTGFIDQTTDQLTIAVAIKDPIVAKAVCENKPLVLHNTGDGEIAGNAANDATLRVKVWYSTVNTGW
jgi:hypothetical protein